jgi:hypothetical protein
VEARGKLAHLRGFALEFAGGKKFFLFKSMVGLWITAENPA